MNILFLCNKSPYPPKEGGPIAMNANITGLVAAGHKVKVLALNTNKYNVDLTDLPKDYRRQTGIEFVYVDLSINPVDAFLNLFSHKSYHVERFETDEVKKKLISILSRTNFDIVQIELIYMAPYLDIIRKYSQAKVILRAHNIEYLIWERIASVTTNPLKKKYLSHLAQKLKRFELSVMNRFDGIAAITAKDADFFKQKGCKVPVTDIPFGINVDDYKPLSNNNNPVTLFHLGSMNWLPNEEGIKWFLDKVWPLIRSRLPDLELYLAGRMMPEWLVKLKLPGVKVLGEVEDATEFINNHNIMIVPLLSGSGIRIKIIEGMALGKTIVSTSIGAEGINYENGKNILIADTPEEFANSVIKCVNDNSRCNEIGKKARKLIETDHNISLIIEKLTGFYTRILKN